MFKSFRNRLFNWRPAYTMRGMPGEVMCVHDRTDLPYLKARVQELEEKVEQLRLSRRVLMNLIDKIEKDKMGFLNRLEKENRKLHQDNYRYAKWLLHKNRQIVELESKLQDTNSRNSSK